jgi:ABC-type glucose/galactose transport system permease subunit
MFTGKKVNTICIVSVLTNVGLCYLGILPVWVTIITSELFIAVMALRSTAKTMESKLKEIKDKEFIQKPSVLNMR